MKDNYRAASDELIGELREQISYLRKILSKEQEARRRADAIIAHLTQANAGLASLVPELEVPPGEPAPPPRPPAGAQGVSGGGEEARWRRLFQG
jgi:hypothetical protein